MLTESGATGSTQQASKAPRHNFCVPLVAPLFSLTLDSRGDELHDRVLVKSDLLASALAPEVGRCRVFFERWFARKTHRERESRNWQLRHKKQIHADAIAANSISLDELVVDVGEDVEDDEGKAASEESSESESEESGESVHEEAEEQLSNAEEKEDADEVVEEVKEAEKEEATTKQQSAAKKKKHINKKM